MRVMIAPDDDEESTALLIKTYTDKEIKQLRKMTEEVRDHWKKMLAEARSEGLRMAIEKSIEQAESDLKEIQEELLDRAH
jgi:hypothetical protein